MFNKTEKDIIHEIALRYNLQDRVAQEIITSCYDLVAKAYLKANKETMEFENVIVPNFGKFFVTETKKKFYKKLIDERNKDIDEGSEDHHEGSGETEGVEGVG